MSWTWSLEIYRASETLVKKIFDVSTNTSRASRPERRIERLEEEPPNLAACERPLPPDADYPDVNGRPQLSVKNRLLCDIAVMALACDQTRVISNFITKPLTNGLFGEATAGHHQLTHDEPNPQPMVNSIVLAIMEELSYYIQALRSVQEGDGTLWTIWFCSQPAKSPMVGFILWMNSHSSSLAQRGTPANRNALPFSARGKHDAHVEYYAGMWGKCKSFGEGEGRVVDGLSTSRYRVRTISLFTMMFMLFGCADSPDETHRDAPPIQDALLDGMMPRDASIQDVAADGAPNVVDMPVQNVLLRTLYFARQEDMISEGFDLDGVSTRLGDGSGCGIADFTNSAGVEGIDNQFAVLLPMIEKAGGMAIESYATAAVLSGNLLLMLELDNVESMENDPEVSLGVYRALGTPWSDGEIEAWQTFDLDVNDHWLKVEDARIENGILRADDFNSPCPSTSSTSHSTSSYLKHKSSWSLENGQHRGMFGGAVDIENILFITENIGGEQLPPLVRTIGRTLADMRPDENGQCQALSVAMNFETVGAFFYADTDRIEEADE